MNLNKLAKVITLKEGKKKQISIAQVKEVLKITLIEFAKRDEEEVLRTIRRYK